LFGRIGLDFLYRLKGHFFKKYRKFSRSSYARKQSEKFEAKIEILTKSMGKKPCSTKAFVGSNNIGNSRFITFLSG
jgi:hypothetical protein